MKSISPLEKISVFEVDLVSPKTDEVQQGSEVIIHPNSEQNYLISSDIVNRNTYFLPIGNIIDEF